MYGVVQSINTDASALGEARAALTALARHRGCSQREVIESLIVAEKNALVSAMDIDDLARFYEQVTR